MNVNLRTTLLQAFGFFACMLACKSIRWHLANPVIHKSYTVVYKRQSRQSQLWQQYFFMTSCKYAWRSLQGENSVSSRCAPMAHCSRFNSTDWAAHSCSPSALCLAVLRDVLWAQHWDAQTGMSPYQNHLCAATTRLFSSPKVYVEHKHTYRQTHTHLPDLSFYPHLGQAHARCCENADRLNKAKGALPDGDGLIRLNWSIWQPVWEDVFFCRLSLCVIVCARARVHDWVCGVFVCVRDICLHFPPLCPWCQSRLKAH